jgi:hypothetical protein
MKKRGALLGGFGRPTAGTLAQDKPAVRLVESSCEQTP